MPQVLLTGSQRISAGLVAILRTPSVAASAMAIRCLVLVVACSVELVLAWVASMEMVRTASGNRCDSACKVGMSLVELVCRMVQGGTSVGLATTDLPVASLGLEMPHRLVAMRLVVEVSIVASVVVDE